MYVNKKVPDLLMDTGKAMHLQSSLFWELRGAHTVALAEARGWDL